MHTAKTFATEEELIEGIEEAASAGWTLLSHAVHQVYDRERHTTSIAFHAVFTDALASAAGQGEQIASLKEQVDNQAQAIQSNHEAVMSAIAQVAGAVPREPTDEEVEAILDARDNSGADTVAPTPQIAEADKLAANAKPPKETDKAPDTTPPTEAKPEGDTVADTKAE